MIQVKYKKNFDVGRMLRNVRASAAVLLNDVAVPVKEGWDKEIKEELDIDLNYQQVKYFLKISINSKHFKKSRSRYYYSINITESQLNSIVLKEGDSYHLLSLSKIDKLNFVPWDLSAILYFENYIRQKRSVKQKKF